VCRPGCARLILSTDTPCDTQAASSQVGACASVYAAINRYLCYCCSGLAQLHCNARGTLLHTSISVNSQDCTCKFTRAALCLSTTTCRQTSNTALGPCRRPGRSTPRPLARTFVQKLGFHTPPACTPAHLSTGTLRPDLSAVRAAATHCWRVPLSPPLPAVS
jgi:hypothetical protein